MGAVRFLVSGKVQGVWFRAATREQALRLDLRGYARNLEDGNVEVVAQGDESSLALLESWLWRGPPLAKVSEVAREAMASPPQSAGFSIL